MNVAPKQSLGEIKRLRRCINDLISFQTLPAVWSGLGADEIINTLLDALISALRLDFACARFNDSMDGPPIQAVRLPSTHNPDAQLRDRRTLESWLNGDLATKPAVTPNPIGTGKITIAPFRLGLQDEIGTLVAASERADFPTELETIVLR